MTVGAHCVHADTVGADLLGGQRSGLTSRGRRRTRSWMPKAVEITPREHISERILLVHRLQEENVEVIQRSVEGIISQEHISARPQVVDATVPQIMEELQERISQRMHEQVVDAPVPMTVHQPGSVLAEFPQSQYIDKVVDMLVVMQRQVFQIQMVLKNVKVPINQVTKHAEFPQTIHRKSCCRYACADAVEGPSDSDCIEDSGKLADAVRWQSCVGTCYHADVPTPHVALQERISERMHKQIVDVPVPHVTLQERISEGMHKQIVDVPMPHVALKKRISERIHEQTVDQPGDQDCRDPEDSVHRQGCRYACGDATSGPSDSDGVDDHGRPADAVRWQSYGGADGMRQVACPKCGCLTTFAEDDACDECGEYSHIRKCAACICYACTRCTEAALADKLPWEARRRRGRGRHWW